MEQCVEDLKLILENINKETLAGKLEVSSVTVSRWVGGVTPNFATREMLKQIADEYRTVEK